MKTKKSSHLFKTKKTKKTSKINHSYKLSKSSKNKYSNKLNIIPDNTFIDKFGQIDVQFKTYNTKRLPNANTYKLFSVCYFVMENSAELHKKKKYLKGLLQLINTIEKEFPDYKIRIYCDKHAFEMIKYLIKKPFVELYMYNIPKFLSKSGYHFGYIGTIIRYFPLFDLSNHFCDRVVCFDIDNNMSNKIINLVKYDLDNKAFLYWSHSCYHVSNRFRYMGNLDFSIMGGLIASNPKLLKMPKNIISNFFNNYLLKDNKHYNLYLKFMKNEEIFKKQYPKLNNYKKSRFNGESIMIKYNYGIDEYFLNVNVRKYLMHANIKTHFIIFGTQHNNAIGRLIKQSYLSNNIDINIKLFNMLRYFCKELKLRHKPIKFINLKNKNNVDINDLFNNNEILNNGINEFFFIYNHKKSFTQQHIKKIKNFNYQINQFIIKYYNELLLKNYPEIKECIKFAIKNNDYGNYFKAYQFLYNKNNTNFIPLQFKDLTPNNIKDLDINIPNMIKYINSKEFQQY